MEVVSGKDPDHQAFIEELRDRQRDIVFPDTVRNGRNVDLIMWRGNPDAPLIQRIGIGLFALLFLGWAIALIALALESGADNWPLIAVALPFLFVSIRLGMNTFRRKQNIR